MRLRTLFETLARGDGQPIAFPTRRGEVVITQDGGAYAVTAPDGRLLARGPLARVLPTLAALYVGR